MIYEDILIFIFQLQYCIILFKYSTWLNFKIYSNFLRCHRLISPRRFELLLHRYQQCVLTNYTMGFILLLMFKDFYKKYMNTY